MMKQLLLMQMTLSIKNIFKLLKMNAQITRVMVIQLQALKIMITMLNHTSIVIPTRQKDMELKNKNEKIS